MQNSSGRKRGGIRDTLPSSSPKLRFEAKPRPLQRTLPFMTHLAWWSPAHVCSFSVAPGSKSGRSVVFDVHVTYRLRQAKSPNLSSQKTRLGAHRIALVGWTRGNTKGYIIWGRSAFALTKRTCFRLQGNHGDFRQRRQGTVDPASGHQAEGHQDYCGWGQSSLINSDKQNVPLGP